MTSVLHLPLAALVWLGRQGTRAIAASVFIGIAVPPFAAALKPFIAETIFLLLVLAFLRTEPRALRAYFVQPGLIAAATAWIMVVTPAAIGLALIAVGLDESAPGLYLALILQASAAPIMSGPAFTALLGLDAALSLATLMACMITTPLTAPFFVHVFAGSTLPFSAAALSGRLVLLLGGSVATAWTVRRLAGHAWVTRQRERIDGINVLMLAAFAMGIMDGVAAAFGRMPLLMSTLVVISFVVTLTLMGLTGLVFARAGRGRPFALGHAAGNRNMGLMLAAIGSALPDLAWLYIGLAQLPIYLLPYFLQPLARRLNEPSQDPD